MVLLGADFASYQPNVDWPTYAACGRSFAMVKATEEVSYLSPLFGSQMQGAQAAGVAVGCTHYIGWTDPEAEAVYFVRAVRAVTVLTGVPLAGDIERGAYALPADPQDWLEAWTAAVAAQAGYPPIIYSSSSYLSSVGLVVPTRSGQWVAAWQSSPPGPLPGGSLVALWQHAASQQIPGSPNPTDSDVFFGTVERFRAYGGR